MVATSNQSWRARLGHDAMEPRLAVLLGRTRPLLPEQLRPGLLGPRATPSGHRETRMRRVGGEETLALPFPELAPFGSCPRVTP